VSEQWTPGPWRADSLLGFPTALAVGGQDATHPICVLTLEPRIVCGEMTVAQARAIAARVASSRRQHERKYRAQAATLRRDGEAASNADYRRIKLTTANEVDRDADLAQCCADAMDLLLTLVPADGEMVRVLSQLIEKWRDDAHASAEPGSPVYDALAGCARDLEQVVRR
jgi:hypothetical protein